MKITLDIPEADLEKIISSAVAEPRIPLHSVTWEQYETLIATVGERPRLRMTYLEGTLEIMTISPEHEMLKKMIARLLEVYALEKDIDLYSCGSATFKSQAAARGLKPDESYCVGTRKEIPDLAIEVVITSGGINKLDVYKGLKVSEVWFWEAGNFSLYRLQESTNIYQPISRSELLPLDLALLASYIKPAEEPSAVKEFRNAIRRL